MNEHDLAATMPLDNLNMSGLCVVESNPQFDKLDDPVSAGMLPPSSSIRLEVRIFSTPSKISPYYQPSHKFKTFTRFRKP
jgi:hypothetical protein